MTTGLGKLYKFVVVDHLSTPVILGCDFLIRNGYVLDFEQCTFYCSKNPEEVLQLQPAQTIPQPLHMITIDDECPQAIPTPCKHTHTRHAHRHSSCPYTHTGRIQVIVLTCIGSHKHYTAHYNTGNAAPIKVPPLPIPFHYSERVH